MPRLFVAVNVPPNLRSQLTAAQSTPDGVRWTPPHQLHLTLRFLGDVNEETARSVERALDELPPIQRTPIQASGITAFPSRRSPRVIVAAIERHPALMKLQAAVESAMQEIGFAQENRDFRPHITLGRVKSASPEDVHNYLKSNSDLAFFFHAEEITLTESTLSPDGAQHVARKRVRIV